VHGHKLESTNSRTHKPWYGAWLNHLMGGGGGCFELHRCSGSMGILRNKWTSEWKRIIATASAPCTTIWPMAKCTYRYAHIPLIYSPKHLEIVCCSRVLTFEFIQHCESTLRLFRSIIMLCGTDSISWNILHIWSKYEEYSMEYYQSHYGSEIML
jgi:hypothetical protein